MERKEIILFLLSFNLNSGEVIFKNKSPPEIPGLIKVTSIQLESSPNKLRFPSAQTKNSNKKLYKDGLYQVSSGDSFCRKIHAKLFQFPARYSPIARSK